MRDALVNPPHFDPAMTRGWTIAQWLAYFAKQPEADFANYDENWAYGQAARDWMLKRDPWFNEPLTPADYKAGKRA